MVQAFQLKLKNSTRKLILLKLADNANDQGYCWPSYNHIADMCEIDKRTAMRHIKVLIELGYVEKELRPGKNGNTSNMYLLRLDKSRGDKLPPPSVTGVTPLVTHDHPPSDRVSPESVIESVKEKDIYANLDFSHWPERPPNEFLDEHVSHRKQKRSVKLSQPVLDRLGKQVTKAIAMGYPLTEILNKWLSKAWIGFEAEWLTNENGMKTTSGNDGSDRAKKLLAQSRQNFGMDKK